MEGVKLNPNKPMHQIAILWPNLITQNCSNYRLTRVDRYQSGGRTLLASISSSDQLNCVPTIREGMNNKLFIEM